MIWFVLKYIIRNITNRVPININNLFKIIWNLSKLAELSGFNLIEILYFKDIKINFKLRYDLTSCLKYLNFKNLNIYNLYKFGHVFRNEKYFDIGRYCQFIQFDFDTIGNYLLIVEIEHLSLILNIINFLNFKNIVKLIIGNKKILISICEIFGILFYKFKFNRFFSHIDKYLYLNWSSIKELLTFGRFDQSGDFIPGIRLSNKIIENFLNLISFNYNKNFYYSYRIKSNFSINSYYLLILNSLIGELGIRELLYFNEIFLNLGIDDNLFYINPLLARGLNYYTGCIFEVFVKILVLNKNNIFVKIGSVISGGRYDNFLYDDSNKFISSFGFSIGIYRIFDLYYNIVKYFNINLNFKICICYSNNINTYYKSIKYASLLRINNIKVDIINKYNTLSEKLKYVDKIGYNIVLIPFNNYWIIKDLNKGKLISIRFNRNIIWRNVFVNQVIFYNNKLLNLIKLIKFIKH